MMSIEKALLVIAWLSLCFILETSWVALYSVVCQSVCQASVSPDQISTFSNIYRHTSPLLTMYHLISSSTNLYWPSTSQYRHILTQYHQVPLIIHHLMSHAQYTWSSCLYSFIQNHIIFHTKCTGAGGWDRSFTQELAPKVWFWFAKLILKRSGYFLRKVFHHYRPFFYRFDIWQERAIYQTLPWFP